jgi:methylmalonyl-CoA carboxyltransferase large subunit
VTAIENRDPVDTPAPAEPVDGAAPAEPVDTPGTADLLARIEELTRRVEWLEATVNEGPPAPPAVPPDVVMAISAAVAAYLGKRATVRQVHLRSHSTWAKQGRAQVMAHEIQHGNR